MSSDAPDSSPTSDGPRIKSIASTRPTSSNGDYSNWFSPNRRAIEDGLRTAGFEPTFLSEWGDRIAYKAEKLEGIPEYLQQTYEGVRFVRDAAGALRNASTPRVGPPRPRSNVEPPDASAHGTR